MRAFLSYLGVLTLLTIVDFTPQRASPTHSLSLNGQVSLRGPIYLRLLCDEELLLLVVVVCDLFLLFARDPSHYGALPGVTLVVLDVDSLSKEVKLYLISCFTMVQSDLDAACT